MGRTEFAIGFLCLLTACSDPSAEESSKGGMASLDAVVPDGLLGDSGTEDAAADDSAKPVEVDSGSLDTQQDLAAPPEDSAPDTSDDTVLADVTEADSSSQQDSDAADGTAPLDALSCGPSCDDADPCTADSCDGSTGICAHAVVAGLPCEDGQACTQGDSCVSGKCQPGKLASNCSCLTTADCAAVDDGKLCNGTLACVLTKEGSQCVVQPETVYNCQESEDSCQIASCVEPTPGGKPTCTLQPAVDGKGCDDGKAWTIGDWCQGGVCQAGTDTAPCLKDSDCVKYEDQNLCNGTTFCNKVTASCTVNPKTVVVCPSVDDTACAKSLCQPKSGLCDLVAIAEGAACNDGDSCTKGEACEQGKCTASAGANVCVCKQDSDCAKLEDGDACNGTMYCDKAAATCKLNPATVVVCPSAFDTDCTKSVCVKASGQCQPTWMPDGTLCDADGSACTPVDVCQKGVCKADTPVCECQADTDCAAKEDGNPCNGTLYCNKVSKTCQVNPSTVVSCQTALDTDCVKNTCQPATGKCLPVSLPLGSSCTDSNACTQGDGCDGQGACVPGTPFCDCLTDVDCPDLDKEPCNGVRYCDKLAAPYKCKDKPGSVLSENSACSDGTVCTIGDHCVGGLCKGAGIGCDDSNPCTDDLCDAKGGCVNLPNEVTCTDSNPCTVGEMCGAGKCLAGKPVNCDDGNPCTVDACEVKVGCMHANSTQPCSDGNACTVGDVCVTAKCVPGLIADCADASACTDDSCNTQTGCEHLLNQASCTDGNPCTAGDKCNGTVCVPGTLLNCNDNEQCTTDSCNGAKGVCEHVNVQGPCSDGNACSTQDACGSSGGKWTCVAPGKPNCDDGNPCTNDSCDTAKGCVQTVNSFSAPCYTGPAGTDKYSPCKAGTKYCSNGAFGACQAEVKPTGEVCNGVDDNCDGAIDNGVNCDDGNACKDDVCAGQGGCQHPNVGNNTKWCATWGICSAGGCLTVEAPKWVTIPAGDYKVGCVPGDSLCLPDEKPQHSVKMSSYTILETEVTVAQYLKCVHAGKCTPPATNKPYGCDGTQPLADAMNWTAAGGARADRYDHPINCVSSYMAVEFCEWHGGIMQGDVPTEAQFEVAARANFQLYYVWSNNFPPTNAVANLGDVTGKAKFSTMPTTVSATYNDTFASTCPVKAFKPNGFGLYGMAGNVQEWTVDAYSATFYSTPAATGWNPGNFKPGERVMRGGSWWSGPAGAAVQYRVSYRGNVSPDQTYGTASGFRCAK